MWPPQIQHKAPASGIIKYWLARIWLSLLGWKVTGQLPQDKKFVLVGGPHTSNWDFFIGLPALFVYRLDVMWMGKDTLFKGLLGPVTRGLGGIAIDRSSPQGTVEQMVDQINKSNGMVLVIPAKGTRSKTDYWKSGFYHIAQQAEVPVVCGYLDFATKTAKIEYRFEPTGDYKADMDGVRQYFEPVKGKYPELADNIRLREEGD